MSRRKKPQPTATSVVEKRPGPEPDPPKPNRLLLAVTGLLFALWIVFLAVLAAAT
ncbi:MAG: hypothetical protein HUU20_00385 [Pirellulales bacterium]|nr:hypothetical protein [Pirellulales bacterium]